MNAYASLTRSSKRLLTSAIHHIKRKTTQDTT